ncbi:sensor histidine kinase [Cohnella sp. GbtcB17]|uniref:sensor histidine kinase n=1 Tax=Cohnella sp. GbtcB17 TaxID=2824762 RepID=UPI001C2F1BB6|nr:sensor histidine kinase [Cohnella sp. GbtcB17]
MPNIRNCKPFQYLNVLASIPIRHKIVAAVFLLILLPMTLAGFYFHWSISYMLTKNANENLSQLIHQTNDNIENSFQIIDNTSLHFLSNKAVRTWSVEDVSLGDDFYKKFLNKSEIEEDLKYSLMFNNAWNISLLSTAYVFFDADNFISVLKSQPNIEQTNQHNLSVYRTVSKNKVRGKEILPPSAGDPTLYFTRIVSNIDIPTQRLVLIFGTSEADLSAKYAELIGFPGSMAYIIDNRGFVYSSSDKRQLGLQVEPSILQLKDSTTVNDVSLDGQKYIFASQSIGGTGLTFIVGIPKKQILAKLSDSIRNYVWIIVLIASVSTAAGILVSLRFTRFIRDLFHSFNKVKQGDYNTVMPSYKDVELNLLSGTFNKMTGEIKHLIGEVYEKQLLVKVSEIKFLQSQMNPHFLFNTLITIGYKARLSKDETVYKMVTAMTELLQAGIYSGGTDMIPIRQELEFIRFYLYIQKERFDDKFDYAIEVEDESILDLRLPKLSIEPLVENAIVHGLEKKVGKGTLTLRIRREGDTIYFEITDNGLGFESGLMDKDHALSAGKKKTGHHHIGLNNTNKRIKLIYGDAYGIDIESRRNLGSKVTVRIPADRGETSYV